MSYFTGPGRSRTEVAQAIVDGQTGAGAGRLARPPARRPARPRLQRRDRPEGERPVRLAAALPAVPGRRSSTRGAPSGSSISTCWCCSGSGSRCSSSTAREITASVAAHLPGAGLRASRGCCGSGVRPRDRAGPLDPGASGAVAGDRAPSSLAVRADRPQRRRLARDRHRRRRGRRRRPHHPRAGRSTTATSRPASESAATSTGRSTTSPTCPFEAGLPLERSLG